MIDWRTGAEVLDVTDYEATWVGAAFNTSGELPSERYVAIGINGVGLEVYDLQTGERLLGPVFEYIQDLEFDPTGRYLAVGGTDGRAAVIDFEAMVSGATIEEAGREIQTPWGLMTDVDMSSKGVLSLAGEGGFNLYDLASLDQVGEGSVRAPGLWLAAAFSPTGDHLLYTDDVLRRFYLDIDRAVQIGEELVTRELTPDECQTFVGASCDAESQG